MVATKIRNAWWVSFRFKHATGRIERIRRRSPVNTRAGAEKYERQLRDQLLEGATATAAVPTLAVFVPEYLKHCDTTNRPSYARQKAATLRRHLLPVFGARTLDAIDARAIAAYRGARSRAGAANKTINNEIIVLLHVLSTARDWSVLSAVPRVRPLPVQQDEIEFYSEDDAARLMAAAGCWRTMVLVALRTGLRLGELRGLRWRDVDLGAGRLVVRVSADETNALTPPKSGKPREVPLSDDCAAALRQHRHLRTHVFDNEDGTVLTMDQCRHAMDSMVRRAGLALSGWHVLRHTFASWLVMRGVPLKAVQELLGHASIAMTMRYAHLSPDVKRDAVRLLDKPVRGRKEEAEG